MMRIFTIIALLCCCLVGQQAGVNGFTSNPPKSRATCSSSLCMAKIGLFFGTSTGSTEEAADLIVEELGSDIVEGPIEIDTIQGSVAQEFGKHDALIVGTPTWNTGADTERSGTGWDEVYYGEMQEMQLQGKKVAVFGLGDQVSYSENYADASGELHDVFQGLGAQMMGYTSQEGYEHEDSKSIRGDKFCGLLLDAVNQEDLTADRVKAWVSQLKEEGILEGEAAGGASVASAPPPPAVVEAAPPSVPNLVPNAQDVFVMESTTVNGLASEESVAVSSLEEENARLRKMLEENSALMDQSISVHGGGNDFIPHYNPKTQRTMYTSPDGRKCYYDDASPKMSTNFSPYQQ